MWAKVGPSGLMAVFRGEHALTIDAKGRVPVPAKFRDRLKALEIGTVVLTLNLMSERCLSAYPLPEWERLEDDIRRLPSLDDNAYLLTHLLIGQATECDMDGHGRILVPQSLRDSAGLDRRLRMVGLVHKFELWNEDVWTERRKSFRGKIGEIKVDPESILGKLVF